MSHDCDAALAGGATLPRPRVGADHDARIARCRAASLALLERNLTPRGILAATPGPQAQARSSATTRAVASAARGCT